MARQQTYGFTLIELLVVVAIIVALLAILMPSMSRAIEVSHRAVCSSNLHQTSAANIAFASDRFGAIATGKPVGPFGNSGIYAIWMRGESFAGYEEYGEFSAQGVLGALDYTDPRGFYCPSSTYEGAIYGQQSKLLPQGGGWFEDRADVPASQRFFWTTYLMRATFGGAPYRAATVSRVSGGDAVFADMFSDPKHGRDVRAVHREGYNIGYIDGSVSWYADPDEDIRHYHNGGQAYFSGATAYVKMEEVWRDFFSR